MTIYKIRAFVNHWKKKGGYEREYDFEEIIVDNLETAREIYKQAKNKCECFTQYSNRTGKVQLFIPEIFDSGILSNYPKEEIYIEQKIFE
jgi:hypothetical protein